MQQYHGPNKFPTLTKIYRIEDFEELSENPLIPITESGNRWLKNSNYYLSELGSVFVVIPPKADPIFIGINTNKLSERMLDDLGKYYNFTFSWNDLLNELKERQKPPAKSVFRAQRIDDKGNLLWPESIAVGEAPEFAMTIPREIKLQLMPDGRVQADLYRGMAGDAVWRISEYKAIINSDGQAQIKEIKADK